MDKKLTKSLPEVLIKNEEKNLVSDEEEVTKSENENSTSNVITSEEEMQNDSEGFESGDELENEESEERNNELLEQNNGNEGEDLPSQDNGSSELDNVREEAGGVPDIVNIRFVRNEGRNEENRRRSFCPAWLRNRGPGFFLVILLFIAILIIFAVRHLIFGITITL